MGSNYSQYKKLIEYILAVFFQHQKRQEKLLKYGTRNIKPQRNGLVQSELRLGIDIFLIANAIKLQVFHRKG